MPAQCDFLILLLFCEYIAAYNAFYYKAKCNHVNANTDKQLYDILIDDDFINYVLNPTQQLISKWENYFERYPEKLAIANQAKKILTGEEQCHHLTEFEVKEMEFGIFERCRLQNCN